MKGTSRVLVTNQLHFLNCADKIVVLEHQEPVFVGTYEELNRSHINLSALISQQTQDTGEQHLDDEHATTTTTTEINAAREKEQALATTPRPTTTTTPTTSPNEASPNKVSCTQAKQAPRTKTPTRRKHAKQDLAKLTTKETMEKGAVAWSVIKMYIKAGNVFCFVAIVFSFLNRLAARVWYSGSLSQWTNDAEAAEGLGADSSSSLFDDSQRDERVAAINNHYIMVQGLLLLYETAAYVIVGLLWMFFGRRASAKIQKGFINLITFAKSTFYDTFVLALINETFTLQHTVARAKQNTSWAAHLALLQGLCKPKQASTKHLQTRMTPVALNRGRST